MDADKSKNVPQSRRGAEILQAKPGTRQSRGRMDRAEICWRWFIERVRVFGVFCGLTPLICVYLRESAVEIRFILKERPAERAEYAE
jgi:hypothetical protein